MNYQFTQRSLETILDSHYIVWTYSLVSTSADTKELI